MDQWGWDLLRPWLAYRVQIPVGPLFCVIDGRTRGRPLTTTSVRQQLRRTAAKAGVRRRFAPHQLRHAHAVEMASEGVPLNVIQRQLAHANLGVTSVYLQGIDSAEIIDTVHSRRAPMIPPAPVCANPDSARPGAARLREEWRCRLRCPHVWQASSTLGLGLWDHRRMAGEEWKAAEHANRYLALADEVPHRAEGEAVLSEQVPRDARRILDLGTGDGRLLALLRIDRPAAFGVGLDFSELMLDAAHERFAAVKGIQLIKHDLADPLPALGRFDVIVSSMAIHHLEHERKRSLYGEVFDLLEPGGVFANFEHVASATHRLHLAFFAAINEPLEHEDPSDRLLDVETQLGWLREHGFDDVDCYWKWLEMALLVGVKPDNSR